MEANFMWVSSPTRRTLANWPVVEGFAISALTTWGMRNITWVLAGTFDTGFAFRTVLVKRAFSGCSCKI